MKFLKKIKDSKLNFILMLLYPIVTFYLLEWFTHNPWKTMKATPVSYTHLDVYKRQIHQ